MWLLPYLHRVCAVAARSYYRLDIDGESIPASGPVLLVANHPNSLFDPALVSAAAGRPVRFLAKEPLIHHPGIGWLIRGAGSIPIYRMEDDPRRVQRNDDSFRAAHEALAAGAAIGMFPEGISHDLPNLAPMKTGAARIALGGARRLNQGFPIIPIGLTFRGKEHFRSEALVLVGKPIEWEDLVREQRPPVAIRELTRRIGTALREQTLNLESWQDAPLVEWAAAIYAAEAGAHAGRAARIRLEREASAALEEARGYDRQDVRELVHEVEGHARVLTSFGLGPSDLLELPGLRDAAGRTVRQGAVLLATSGVGLLGHLLFFVPAALTIRAVEMMKPTPDIRSTYVTLGGALFFSIWIVLIAFGFGVTTGPAAAGLALIALPGLALAAIVFRDRWSDARAVARRYLFFRSRRDLQRQLAIRQTEIAGRLRQLRDQTLSSTSRAASTP